MRRYPILAVVSLLLVSCAQRREPAAATRPAAPSHDLPGVHNVHRAAEGVYSGGVPEGDSGFDTLRELGVKTVISVDGARPDVAAAEARGMRYVHLPIGYDGIPSEQRPNLLRALRDLPEPIFIHCHHGKHRSPAATAFALVGLGKMTPDEGVAFLAAAGTSKHYAGLYQCVSSARKVDAAWLDRVTPEFPQIAEPPSFVAAMTQLDAIWERLGQVAKSEWRTPPEHPDLVPAAEAVLLAEAFREMQRDERMHVEPPEFSERMRTSEVDAWKLADALRASDSHAARRYFDRLEADCKSCHQAFRDQGRVHYPTLKVVVNMAAFAGS